MTQIRRADGLQKREVLYRHILRVKPDNEKRREYYLEAHLISVDVEKAFDNISRPLL